MRNGNHYDLTGIPIEELMSYEFLTVLKKPSTIFEAPAAAFSLTGEEIQKSGVTNLPDALRMVPGVQVSQHNASNWAITMRGFSGMSRGISGQFANKLLVLQDGRSLYTPLFSGVSWDAQDALLEDLARLEVIRGPGAALWGANSVNGIINIVSKESDETQGIMVNSGVGSEQRVFSHIRYGGKFGRQTFFRVYGKVRKVDDLADSEGNVSVDSWHTLRGGFRMDSYHGRSSFMLEAEAYDGKAGQRYNTISEPSPPFPQEFNFEDNFSGGHILGRWQQRFSNTSELTLQAYFDRVKRDEAVVKGRVHTLDFDFHHRFRKQRHEILWGAGYRFTSDSFDSTFAFALNPASRDVDLLNAFVQDEIGFARNRLFLTLGSRFEHNEYTGLEVQPNLRLRWLPNERYAFWVAASRAVRTPSRGEIDARIILEAFGDSTLLVFSGNNNFKSEKLLALEAGFRSNRFGRLTWDVATFFNIYHDLRTDELDGNFPERDPGTGFFFKRIFPKNKMDGHTYGLELSADWLASHKLTLHALYAYLQMELTPRDRQDRFAKSIEGQSPEHQFSLASDFVLNDRIQINTRIRYVDSLPSQQVSEYLTADFSINWKAGNRFRITVVGQNLLQSQHAESSQILTAGNTQIVTRTRASEVQRGIYGKATWRF